MTDKEKIKEEIERRIKESSSKNDISEGALALDSLIDFIDSLPEESASEDLDFQTFAKEMDAVFALPSSETENTEENPLNWEYAIARHFAEWQKEQMMKDAVEGEVRKGYVGNQIVIHSKDNSAKYVAFDASYADEFCVGDKVKIIIVKSE